MCIDRWIMHWRRVSSGNINKFEVWLANRLKCYCTEFLPFCVSMTLMKWLMNSDIRTVNAVYKCVEIIGISVMKKTKSRLKTAYTYSKGKRELLWNVMIFTSGFPFNKLSEFNRKATATEKKAGGISYEWQINIIFK